MKSYYTGNWASNVADNFTEKQSKKSLKLCLNI